MQNKQTRVLLLAGLMTFNVGAEELVPKIISSTVENQVIVEIPVLSEVKLAPSLSFSVFLKKSGLSEKGFTLNDGFVSADGKKIVASGFVPPGTAAAKYVLAGIYFQESGRYANANCQVHGMDFLTGILSCYNDGKLRPERYKPISYQVKVAPKDLHQNTKYSNLKVVGSVEKTAEGEDQVVRVSISSGTKIIEYFTSHVVFTDPKHPPGQWGGQLAYFQPQQLSKSGNGQVTVEHLFNEETNRSPDPIPNLEGALISKFKGTNSSNQTVELICNRETGFYSYENESTEIKAETDAECAYLSLR